MIDIGTTGLLAPGRLRWLRAIGWMIALAAALVVAFNAVAKACVWLLAEDASKAFDTDKLIAACAGAVAIFVLYWVAVRVAERRRVSELSLRQLPAELLLGSVIGAALIGLIIGLLWLVGWVIIEPQPVSRIALALRDSIRSGVVEEVLLRLVIFRLLWRGFGIWPALVISAALFGVLHLANPDSSLFAA
ncbi:MAG: CPBP family intramembrane metalloprotease, partial [Sphingomonas bacterium]|nr:CPBP family intramembrane metalloprotease [Sphingomonas bacterium]